MGDQEEELRDRISTDDEVTALTDSFKSRPFSGHYVAPPAPGYDVHGLWHHFPCHGRSGYAAHAIALHWMLHEHLKIPTSLVPHRHASIDFELFPKDRQDMLFRWMKEGVGIPEALIVSLPPDREMWDMTRALVHYVAFEADTVSDFIVDHVVNQPEMTELWCVSDFTRRAFLAGGAHEKKVRVVRPAICDGPWKDMFRPLDQLQERARRPVTHDDPFAFGVLGTWHERKGFHDLLRAYFGSFKREEPVVLRIRTSPLGKFRTIKEFRDTVVKEIAAIAREFGDDAYPESGKMPKVNLQTGTSLTDSEVISWLGDLDCYVNPSYGEGLGIPAIWAAAQGVGVVSSTYGAVGDLHRDMASANNLGFAVFPHRTAPVDRGMLRHSPLFSPKATWGGYDVADLAQTMRESACRAARAGLAAAVRDHFSLSACETQTLEALESIARPEIFSKWRGHE